MRVNGKSYDVLQFNPEAARELLAFAGFPGGRDSQGNALKFDLLFPNFQEDRLRAEILQSEWQDKLSIRVSVNIQELKLLLRNIYSLNYHGITDNVDWGYYRDPTWFLDQFATGASST